jgi:thiol-disulfide isomerase/thioredoxin
MRIVITLFFALTMLLQAAAPVPRKSEALKIVEPSGNTMTLASQEGKVCVIQFLFTWCPHCQDTAKVLSKLQTEFGSKIQVIGVAFNDEVLTKDTAKNNAEVIKFKQYANFPVGINNRETVLKYLGFSVMDRWGVPLMAIVDKKGNVVAQSKPAGSPELQTEAPLRALLTKLVAEK